MSRAAEKVSSAGMSYISLISYQPSLYQHLATDIKFYGGVNEVGGNKILLTDNDTSIFLDFGKGLLSPGKIL